MSLFDGSILVPDRNPKKPIRLICSLYMLLLFYG